MLYDLIAPMYDRENASVDYERWADFLEEVFRREMTTPPALVLDLGCGTGSMTLALARRGYDMTGVDLSPEMLAVAREREAKEKLTHPCLWLCQDMCDFELYGTVDACVCCLDTLNHLTETGELSACFDLVHNYLIPDGVFVFDVNTKHKFETLYASEVYTYEDDDTFTVWENDYRPRSGLCDFYITQFRREADGRYVRTDEVQTERAYSLRTLQTTLKKCGFEFIGAYCDLKFTKGDENADRLYIIARAKK
jgi:SAM-dependent methyltransferase